MPEDLSFPLPDLAQKVGIAMDTGDGYTLRGDIQNLHLAFYRLAPLAVGAAAGDEASGDESAKQQYLRALAKQWGNICEQWTQSASPLSAYRKRLDAQLSDLEAQGRPTQRLHLETEARLVAGLGYDSPMEVGLTLHPLYGFPYLPGSTVKGIARAYAEQVEEAPAEERHSVFGSTAPGEAPDTKQKGQVTFMDAVPTAPPALEVDVMTPHQTPYYQDQEPPGESHQPTPVPFLTVAPGASFAFPLAAQTNDLLDRATDWLRGGLFWLGAGGKTAAGYGLFTSKQRRDQASERRERRRTSAQLPPKKESIGKNTTGILARVVGPSRFTDRECKLDVVLHVEGYEDVEVPMTGSEITVERFDADWVKVSVERFVAEDFPLVRYESKWRP